MGDDPSTRGATEGASEGVRATLDALRDARGFVLPHHGVLAAALPDLHAAYRGMYRALTLDPRHMDPLARECVWLAILASLGEGVGTHHVRLFRQHGGDDAAAAAVFRVAAHAVGAELGRFLVADWGRHFPGVDPAREHLDSLAACIPPLPDATARLCSLAVQAARGNLWALGVELEATYAAGVPEPTIAEALSLIIWPRGVNPFVRATEAWLRVLRSGRVAPSAGFAEWAATPGQGAEVLPTG